MLRIGVHQLLSMRVRDHAAVTTSVDPPARASASVTSAWSTPCCAGGPHDLDGWVRRVAPDAVTDPFGYPAVAHSHPRWVVEELQRALGDRGAAGGAAGADNDAPGRGAGRPGRAHPGRAGRRRRTASTLSPYAAAGRRRPGGGPGGRRGARRRAGRGHAAGRPRPRRRRSKGATSAGWTCAPARAARPRCSRPSRRTRRPAGGQRAPAPPGRAGRLAGAEGVRGGDHPRRARRTPPWPEGSFDRVLVDALLRAGALRRRPEARWRKQPSDLVALARLQRALLERALDAVRPGGSWSTRPARRSWPRPPGWSTRCWPARDDGRVDPVTRQLWPHRDGTDAMFWAVLTRRG